MIGITIVIYALVTVALLYHESKSKREISRVVAPVRTRRTKAKYK